jgi:VanZ family protein
MLRLVIFLRPFAKYLFIVWILTIAIVSSIPSIPTFKIHAGTTEIRLDYFIHFCEYGILAFMAYLSFAGNEFKISCRKYFLLTLFLILFAVVDEFHQKLIPGRAYNVKDIISDVIGILVVLGFCCLVFRKIAASERRLHN